MQVMDACWTNFCVVELFVNTLSINSLYRENLGGHYPLHTVQYSVLHIQLSDLLKSSSVLFSLDTVVHCAEHPNQT